MSGTYQRAFRRTSASRPPNSLRIERVGTGAERRGASRRTRASASARRRSSAGNLQLARRTPPPEGSSELRGARAAASANEGLLRLRESCCVASGERDGTGRDETGGDSDNRAKCAR